MTSLRSPACSESHGVLNLPVKDLKRSVDFFTALGFSFNSDYTDENATCMIVNDGAYVMLLVEAYFKTFISKGIADTSGTAEYSRTVVPPRETGRVSEPAVCTVAARLFP